MLQLADVLDQLHVVDHEGCPRLELALHQSLTYEEPACRGRIDRPEIHPPLLIHQKSVQRGAFQRHHLRGALFPVRIAVRALEQVGAHALEPGRLDARHRSREQARGLHQFSGHDPATGLACQRRARPHVEADLTRAQVRCLAPIGRVGVERLAPDVAEQARQQRQVQLLVSGRRVVQAPAQLRYDPVQLGLHVHPFAQPARADELAPQLLGEPAIGFLVSQPLLQRVPQLDQAGEFGLFVRVHAVRLIGGFLGARRSLARVLHRQRRGDDQHLAQAMLIARRQQHAPQTRVQRQARKLLPDRGELIALVHRVQFGQQLVAIGDRARRGRLHERKARHVSQTQRLHLQDDRRQ